MDYKLDDNMPIYIQIMQKVRDAIASGEWAPGQKIPSVREYAMFFKANPNTICKALSILEDKKLIYTERTNGKFVSNDISVINVYKKDIFNEKINDFLKDLYDMGYTKEEIINKIKEYGNDGVTSQMIAHMLKFPYQEYFINIIEDIINLT